MADNKIILDAGDQKNYLDVISDLIAENRLIGICNIIYTYHTLRGDYIGALLVVDGPMIAHSSGPSTTRRYVFVDVDWNECIFTNLQESYRHIKTLDPSATYKAALYCRVDSPKTSLFISDSVATLALSNLK